MEQRIAKQILPRGEAAKEDGSYTPAHRLKLDSRVVEHDRFGLSGAQMWRVNHARTFHRPVGVEQIVATQTARLNVAPPPEARAPPPFEWTRGRACSISGAFRRSEAIHTVQW